MSKRTSGAGSIRLLTRKPMLVNMLAIAVGAAVGANLRYLVSLWSAQRFGTGFPYGTLIINVLGSLLIGVVLALITGRLTIGDSLRLLLVTGVLGGFTTFSTFSYEAYALITAGSWLLAALYLALSVGLGLAAVVLGVALARLLP